MNHEPLTKKNRLTTLAFLEVGIFEIFFVGIIFVVLFGTLNYFNILSVSDAFPHQLAWLPRQTSSEQKTSKPKSMTVIPSVTRVPTVPEYAKADTKNVINDVLISSLIPNNLVFKKQDVKNPYGFQFYGTFWEDQNKNGFVVAVEYNTVNKLIDRQIMIHHRQVINNLDSTSSAKLTKEYFQISLQAPFKCTVFSSKNPTYKFCEVFWTDNNGIKKGIDVTSPVYGLTETQIFYCEHHEGTPAYSWKSCNSTFKDTGIL